MSELMNEILQYVEEHSGCLRRDINAALGFPRSADITSNYLGKLRREGYVRSEKPSNGATAWTRWYFVTRPDFSLDSRAHPRNPRSRRDRQIAYLMRETGCTSNAAKTALTICAGSADYVRRTK